MGKVSLTRVASEEKFMSGQSARFTAAGSSCRPNLNFKMWRCLSDHVQRIFSNMCHTYCAANNIFSYFNQSYPWFLASPLLSFFELLTWCEKMTGSKKACKSIGIFRTFIKSSPKKYLRKPLVWLQFQQLIESFTCNRWTRNGCDGHEKELNANSSRDFVYTHDVGTKNG